MAIIRSVSPESLGLDLNTSVGLTSNGTVHPTPKVNEGGEVSIVNFFTRSGQALPRSYYEQLVESEDFILQGLVGEPRVLMEARFAEIKKYLEITSK